MISTSLVRTQQLTLKPAATIAKAMLVFFLVVTATACSKQLSGTYARQGVRLEFRDDGQVKLRDGPLALVLPYSISGDKLTIQGPFGGLEYTIVSDSTLQDEHGTYLKQ